MSEKSNIFIDIITSFKGRKNLDDASKGFGILEKSVSHLGTKIGAALSVGAITAFGKSSVDAFLKTDSAMKQLDQTLFNVGQGFAALTAEKNITNLSLASGVAKDKLIPAYSTLVRATKDAAKAQDLLQLSLDISAGTGRDLATVSTSLGKAYGGNVTALGRLGTGLTKAQLTSGNFLDIQKQLTSLFKGDAATAADTYAGKLSRLKAGFTDMQESIGKGIVTGFSNLAGQGGNLDVAIQKMQQFGLVAGVWLGQIITHLKDVKNAFDKVFPGIEWLLSKTVDGWSKILGTQDAYVESIRQSQRDAYFQAKLYEKQAKAQAALNRQIQQDQAKADAKAKKDAADKLVLDKASAQLKKQQSAFDVNAAQIYAALQNDKLDANEKLRLQMLQTEDQLAAAIQNQNIPLVEQLTKKLQDQTDQFAVMQHLEPYAGLMIGADSATIAILKAYEAQMKLNAAIAAMPPVAGQPGSSGGGTITGGTYATPGATPGYGLSSSGLATSGGGLGTVINLNVAGSVLTNQELKDYMVQALVNSTASGTQGTYDRNRLGAW